MRIVQGLGLAALVTGLLMYSAATFIMRDTLEPFTSEDQARLAELNERGAGYQDVAEIEESTRLIRKQTINVPMAVRRANVANWGWLLTMIGAPIFAAGYLARELRRARSPQPTTTPTETRSRAIEWVPAILVFLLPVALIIALIATQD